MPNPNGSPSQREIVTHPSPEGGFVVEIPTLPGCLAQGETVEEALQELAIVEQLWLATAEKYQ